MRVIRVLGRGSQRKMDFGGYAFAIRECTPSSMMLGRYGDHIDAIHAEIVDGIVMVRWDENNLTDVIHATEDSYWTKRHGR